MKNVHVLPTDKPSRLIIYSTLLNEFRLLDEPLDDWKHKRNIYIISDEQIKAGDYCISHLNIIDEAKIHNSQTIFNPKTTEDLIALQSCKKIILTTDQDLIKDGVQAIDDNFLEWFIKNPTCEEVEVDKDKFFESVKYNFYKIILSKEESKCGKNQTAVEWLMKQMSLGDRMHLAENGVDFEQAKAMEKEQIINSFDEGKSDGYKTAREWDEMIVWLSAEQYYNQTFKGGDK
jgi:hypothetical protein